MDHLLEMFQILQEDTTNVRLQINLHKTKIMAIDLSSPGANSPVSLDRSTSIEVIQRFTYSEHAQKMLDDIVEWSNLIGLEASTEKT